MTDTIVRIDATFADRAEALACATAIRDARLLAEGVPAEAVAPLPAMTFFPPDGLAIGADGVVRRFDIVEWGELFTPLVFGEDGGIAGGGEAVPGLHFGGCWRGSAETLPPALLPWLVDRSGFPWWPVIG